MAEFDSEKFKRMGQLRHAQRYFKVLDDLVERYHQGGVMMLQALADFEQEKANILAGQNESIELAHKYPEFLDLCLDYVTRGHKIWSMRTNPKTRIEPQKAALALAKRYNRQELAAYILINIAADFAMLGEFNLAKAYVEDVLKIAENLEDERIIASAKLHLGNIQISLGKTPVLLAESFHQAGRISTEPLSNEIEAIHAIESGNTELLQERYEAAIPHFERGLALVEASGDLSLKWAFLNSLSVAYLQLKKYPKAMHYAQESYALSTAIKDARAQANCLGQIANIHFSQKKYKEAIEFYYQTIALTELQEDQSALANRYYNLGQAFTAVGNTKLALEFLQKSRQLYNQLTKHDWVERVDSLIQYNQNPASMTQRFLARLLNLNIST